MSHPYYPPPVTGREPVFSVRLTKHTGMVVIGYNQRYTVTGSYAQCDAAIRQAQQHNLLAGWWGLISILIWNPIALITNSKARKSLRQQAAQWSYWHAAHADFSRADGRMAPPGR